MSDTQKHPYYPKIQRHLADCIEYIDQHTQSKEIAIGANRLSQKSLNEINEQRRQELLAARPELYSAQLVVEDANKQIETIFLGKTLIPEHSVYSWASEFGRLLYLNPQKVHDDGSRVRLILDLTVHENAVQKISNRFVDSKFEKELKQVSFEDSLLYELLSSSHQELRDIVATIQEQQYQIIQSPLNHLLVVQGAPGSGKSSVALHRIAYLLYNHSRELSEPEILVLGPNPTFLAHVSNILPSLGHKQVPQLTFAQLTERLLGEVKNESQEEALDILLDQRVAELDKIVRYRNARNKGSLEMATLLERYTEYLYDEILSQCSGNLVCKYQPPSINRSRFRAVEIERSVEALRVTFQQFKHEPLNKRREKVIDHLVRWISGELHDQLQKQTANIRSLNDMLSASANNSLEKQVRDQVNEYFKHWQSQNVFVAYRRLLRSHEILQDCGKGLFNAWDLELFVQDAPTVKTPFRFSDLAALMYLALLFDGQRTQYKHLVIDEAQDLSPLHFRVLRRFAHSSSMTVLGDIGQGIYEHHGMQSWDVLSKAIEADSVDPQHLDKSYRSTAPIMQFANALLERTQAPKPYANPINRTGPEPEVLHCENEKARAINLVMLLKHAPKTYKSIAIICATKAACVSLAQQLSAENFSQAQVLIDPTQSYNGGIAIIPAYLTKGLEFDMVIVADADAETYPADRLHQRLLYVALTRAAHLLYVFHIGPISPLLDTQKKTIKLQEFLGSSVKSQLTTIADHTLSSSLQTQDYYVERLARLNRLYLLQRGRIDRVVLDLLVPPKAVSEGQELELAKLPSKQLASVERQARKIIDQQKYGVGYLQTIELLLLTICLIEDQLRAWELLGEDEDLQRVSRIHLFQLVARLLFNLERGVEIDFASGVWVNLTRIQSLIGTKRYPQIKQKLDLMAEHGLIENRITEQQPQVRVRRQSILPLLYACLGYTNDEWENDLVQVLVTLPEKISWN
jgi:DNA helicase-2/ATP-dependent DNA helicase PcrA